MFLTAATKDEVFNFVLKDHFYEMILRKFLSKKADRDEFRQYLWESLCNMKEEKILKAWNNRYFNYLYMAIVKNNIMSSTSPWHLHSRKSFSNEPELLDNDLLDDDQRTAEEEIIYLEDAREKLDKLEKIDKAINALILKNPMLLTEMNLFKMYFYEQLSYRKISKKTNIPLITVFDSVNTAKFYIKNYINKHL